MNRWFGLCRKNVILAMAGGLAMVVLAGQTARAGNISMTVTEGANSVQIGLDFGNFGPGTTSNNVVADTQAVNTALNAAGFDFNFNALGAISNSPASGTNATLLLTGQVFRTTSTGGDATITIQASQNDYTSLASAPGTLTSFASANFVPGGGVSQTATSSLATSNNQYDVTGPSTSTVPIFPPGHTEFEPSLGVPSTPAFSLTNTVVITLGPDTTGGSNPPVDQFTHSTTLVSVPEPASVVMMGMPMAFASLVWLRRRRVTVGR